MPDLTITNIRHAKCLTVAGFRPCKWMSGSTVARCGRADVPSGRSTGSNEAHELRDGGTRFGGFGVLTGGRQRQRHHRRRRWSGLRGVATRARPALSTSTAHRQERARGQRAPRREAGRGASTAAASEKPLFRHLNADAHLLPVPLVNLINGGKHASNDLDFQEFIIVPVGAVTLSRRCRSPPRSTWCWAGSCSRASARSRSTPATKEDSHRRISSPEEALDLLHEAVDSRAGPTPSIRPRLCRDTLVRRRTW